jgi:flagellar biosynthetic protein FliP
VTRLSIGRGIAGVLVGLLLAFGVLAGGATAASAAPPAPASPTAPAAPSNPAGQQQDGTISVNVNGPGGKPGSSVMVILLVTVLSVAPALLLMCTSFTKIFVVLSLTRNALGLSAVPPNQVLAGLALFLSLFVMGPVLSDVNDAGVQPYLAGTKVESQAFEDGMEPLREFMLDHTRKEDLSLFIKAAGDDRPKNRDDVALSTLIPSFVISELRAAFIIGFVIYVPFLVIDLVVSASLMSMGMVMLPPVTVSLPFKLLLFVVVNGWSLIITALVASYR